MRVKEGQHINKSLFFLTQVIALKAEMNNKKPTTTPGQQTSGGATTAGSQPSADAHIPYRNSPLTKILRSSLGGSSRTAIVLCITPAAGQLEQTFSTLRFGQNAKMIRNTVVANVKGIGASENEVRLMLAQYERRLREMEWDKEASGRNMKELIDKLIQEKDELNQRLIKANHNKLQIIQGDSSNALISQHSQKNEMVASETQHEEEGP